MYHLDIGEKEATHALLPEGALEGANRVRMGMGFLRALPGGPIGKQHQTAGARGISRNKMQVEVRAWVQSGHKHGHDCLYVGGEFRRLT